MKGWPWLVLGIVWWGVGWGVGVGTAGRGGDTVDPAPSAGSTGTTARVEGVAIGPRAKVVCVLAIRDDIMPPMAYVVRRGVKEAMEAKADLLVVDLDTNGGRVDVTEEIIGILGRFPGETVTYVNHKAFSAGAFIAVATQRIYMAEESVIGAAAPMMMMPGGGAAQLPETVEAKMTSGIKALIRSKAEKHGHNLEVIEAMIDRNKELEIDGKMINPKGQILTLTSREAAKEYGDPPRPLLSSGTAPSLESLLEQLGYAGATRIMVEPTGVEQAAFWLNTLSPLLLALGLLGIYLEFKTPGFGVPGSIAVAALLLYFAGGYIAGLSGMEWVLVFIFGVILIGLEIFVLPGTLVLGISGSLLILVSIVMAAADLYPGMSAVPTLPQLQLPVRNLALAAGIAMLGVWVLGVVLPRTPAYRVLVSHGVSGGATDLARERSNAIQIGKEGTAISPLHPGGKAQFGEVILDVVTQGEMVGKGARVRILGHSTHEAIVEAV